MSESKSKIISFRLPAEIGILAQEIANAAGDKNASAWCQKLVIDVLAEITDANQIGSAGHHSKPICREDLVSVSSNFRQFVFDCFKLLFKDGEDYKELLKIAIKSEEDSELISKNINELVVKDLTRSDEFYSLEDKSDKCELSRKEEPTENQFVAENISNEFMTFAAEMENEIAEIVSNEPAMTTHQRGQMITTANSATQKQMPVRLPFFDVAEQ